MVLRRETQKGGVRSKSLSRRTLRKKQSILSPNTLFFGTVRSGRARTTTRRAGEKNTVKSYALNILPAKMSMLEPVKQLEYIVNTMNHLIKMLKSHYITNEMDDEISMFLSFIDTAIKEVVKDYEDLIAVHFKYDSYEPMLRKSKHSVSGFERDVHFLERLMKKGRMAKGIDAVEIEELILLFIKSIRHAVRDHKDVLQGVVRQMPVEVVEERDELSDLMKMLSM
jgi:hypothetical protein